MLLDSSLVKNVHKRLPAAYKTLTSKQTEAELDGGKKKQIKIKMYYTLQFL